MLEIKDLSIWMRDTGRPLIEHLHFVLGPTDRAVIIGEEGNGKSSLLKTIVDPSLVEDYCEYSGKVLKNGMLVGYLEQDTPPEILEMTPAEFLDGPALLDGSLSRLAAQLQLREELLFADQRIATLSGGEKVKLRMIRLLAGEPDVLLLDEPTNDIDLATLEWLEGVISGSRVPVLYVSHDETLIERTANVVIHLEQLKKKREARHTVERTGYRQYIAQRLSGLEKQEQVARKQREEFNSQMERWQQIYNKVEHQQAAITRQNPSGGRLLKKKVKALKSQEKRIQKNAENFLEIPEPEEAIALSFSKEIRIPQGKRVLEFHLDQLCAGGDTGRLLAENIHLTVNGPEHIGIIGDNGAGKTTLLRHICRQLQGRSDLKMVYMPQDYRELLPYDQTPVDFLARGQTRQEITQARTYLGSMKYTHEEMTGKIGALSGGQKAKLLFVWMILGEYNLLLLDEPTRNFSPLSNPVIRQMLSDFGGGIISVTHDRKYLEEVCGRIYRLTSRGLEEVYPDAIGLSPHGE